MWTGPVDNWIAACDQIVATGADHIVPGHGPVTDLAGVVVLRGYLEWVAQQAQRAYAAGLPNWEARRPSVVQQEYASWGNPERLVITMAAAYHVLGEERQDLTEVLARAGDAELS